MSAENVFSLAQLTLFWGVLIAATMMIIYQEILFGLVALGCFYGLFYAASEERSLKSAEDVSTHQLAVADRTYGITHVGDNDYQIVVESLDQPITITVCDPDSRNKVHHLASRKTAVAQAFLWGYLLGGS